MEYLDVYREREKNRFTILISQSGCSTNIIEIMKELDKEHQPFVLLTGMRMAVQADTQIVLWSMELGMKRLIM